MTRSLGIGLWAMGCLVAATAAAQQTRSDFHWEKALPAGQDVVVRTISGNVNVTPSSNGKVEVTGTKRGNSRYFDEVRVDVQQTVRGVVICVLYEDPGSDCDEDGVHIHGRNCCDHRASIDLDITVPTNLEVNVGSISGDVTIDGAQGDVRASSVSGELRLRHLRASSIRAHTVSGDIEARVDALTGTGDLSFHSVSGGVVMELPRALDADIRMSTVSGELESDYPLTLNGRMSRRRTEARIGKGGRLIDLSTVSGDVRIRKGGE